MSCVGVGVRVFLVFLVSAFVLVLCASARADDNADGRRHAKRASHLAASGKCKQAIAEYDKALAVIHDPALLFNRGECHRKLGDSDAALKDYNQFLADLPNAPNRVEVEARMAELRKASLSHGPISAPGRTNTDKSGASIGAKPDPPPPTASTNTAPAAAVSPSRVPLRGPESVGSLAPTTGPTPHNPPGATLTLSDQQTTPMSANVGPADDSLTGHAWFWVAIAAAAVGIGVGTYVVLSREQTNIPQSPLGHYRF